MGKKRKACYFQSKEQKKGASVSDAKKFKFDSHIKIGPNMSGFLITYNSKYTFCLNEAKKLLQQFSLPDTVNEEKKKREDDECDDIEKMLKQEVDTINKQDKEFYVLDTGANYTIFIYYKHVDVNKIVESIFDVSCPICPQSIFACNMFI